MRAERDGEHGAADGRPSQDEPARRDEQSSSALLLVEALLRARIGLEPASVGSGWMRSRVQARMEAVGAESVDRYAEVVAKSPQELAELAEQVVVPETWFFRDETPFVFVARHVATEWLPAHPARQLRVLSVPCASGEEPYSVAMALLDAGVDPLRFRVDGVDLRRAALDEADRAVYGARSFRGEDLGYRSRYFRATDQGFELRPVVRDQVRLGQGNILDPELVVGRLPYDVVLCRNLMIYLDRPARETVCRAVTQLLVPDGLLVAGKAETASLWGSGFRALPQVETCTYRRVEPTPGCALKRQVGSRAAPLPKPGRVTDAVRLSSSASPDTAGRDAAQPGGDDPESAGEQLAKARALADRGELDAADQGCARLLAEHGPSADGFVLQAAIASAKGLDDRVEGLLGRALYLEPTHREALTLLALERQRRGDRDGERLIRERLQRLQPADRSGT